MSQSRIPSAVLAAGVTACAVTWWTKPKAYPPNEWSEEANKFSDNIRLGLGPFHYFCEEKGATTAVDRITDEMRRSGIDDLEMVHMIKPGFDTRTDGFILTSGRFLSRVGERVQKVLSQYTRSRLDLDKVSSQFPHLLKSTGKPITYSVRLNLDSDFNPIVSFDDRRKHEQEICSVLADTVGGTYHPLGGSRSRLHAGQQSMTDRMLDALRSQGLVFEAPWTTFDLSSGLGRHWPDARGVWLVDSGDSPVVVWVNHENHVEIVGRSADGVAVMTRVKNLRDMMSQKLSSVAKSDTIGYLCVKPEHCGSGATVSQTVVLKRLFLHPRFRDLTKLLGLNVTDLGNNEFHFVSVERFGLSLAESVRRADSAFRILVNLDDQLDASQTIDQILKFTS